MVTIYGGKLTDCLNVGEEVAEIIGSFGITLKQPDAWYGEPGVQDETEPGECVIGTLDRTQIQRMAEEEMIVHLEDFLRRRTMLELTRGREALQADPGLKQAARILFGDRADAELARYFD